MHFLRLIRPINLLVIALTMYGVQVFLLSGMDESVAEDYQAQFFVLVFSTVLIAAAGNIINDYFDVRADRVNKPDRLIITRHIKQRWAIVTHWIFNLCAFIMAGWLSWKNHTFSYLFIALIAINALWFYSLFFKRRFLIGNLVVATLTGFIPVYAWMHFTDVITASVNSTVGGNWYSSLLNGQKFVWTFAAFAFLLNLIREIIKDMQDVSGDQLLGAKTIPIVLGTAVSKTICISLLGLVAVGGITVINLWHVSRDSEFFVALSPLLLVLICMLLSAFFLFRTRTERSLKHADTLLKVAMLIGCTLPFYWILLR